MSLAELTNEPIELTLGGITLKLKRLSLSELFPPAQAKILSEYRNNVNEMAKGLTGETLQIHLKNALKETPRGAELDRLVHEYYASPVGQAEMLLIAFNKCQPITEEQLTELVSRATKDEYHKLQYATAHASGTDVLEEEDKKKLTPELKEATEAKEVQGTA